MKKRKIIALILSLVLLLSSAIPAAAYSVFNTQYTYDKSDFSWLRDLIVKEDMTSLSGLSKRSQLKAVTNYPYTENKDTFSEKINNYAILYSLDSTMTDAAYLYALSLAENFAQNSVSSDKSDDFIKAYIISSGVEWPDGENADSSETKIAARIVYALMTGDSGFTVAPGTGLYDAFEAYISKIFGVDKSVILKMASGGSVSNLKDFVFAACRYALYRAGYDVDANTSDEETARLVAVMTVKTQGITINEKTATADEIKSKYLAAVLDKIYGVNADPDEVWKAKENGDLPLYMIKVIGKENGVTVSSKSSYEDAFNTVLTKTDVFKIKDGDFYSDIFEYNISLEYKRSSIWINPETASSDSVVTINGERVNQKNYSRISIDPKKEKQTVEIKVDYTGTDSGSKTSVYKINITQGKKEAPAVNTISSALSSVSSLITNVSNDLTDGGKTITPTSTTFASLVSSIPFALPGRVISIASLLIPNTEDVLDLGSDFLTTFFGYFNQISSGKTSVSSNVNSNSIGGVGGLDAYNNSSSSGNVLSVNFEKSGIPGYSATVAAANSGAVSSDAKTANQVIISNDALQADANKTQAVQQAAAQTKSSSLLISDPKTATVVICSLIVLFGACFFIFYKIVDMKAQNGEFRLAPIRGERKEKRISNPQKQVEKYRRYRKSGGAVEGKVRKAAKKKKDGKDNFTR